MKTLRNLFSLLLTLTLLLCTASGAAAGTTDGGFVDYVAQLKLNMSSATAKTSASVRTHVDGDTVHFNVPESVCADGVLKARFLALNTPESTGKIEEYGVAASHFTQEKLASAVSIILESDSDRWELDSTGGRMLVWVWYQPSEGAEYRNLNLELLQNGYARAYSTANNQYGSICSSALDQARQFKLNLYSGQPDPDFYYGDAIELTLRELRCHPEAYQNKKVAFNGIVTLAHNNSVYVESLDAESGIVFGISVYYGFNLSGKGLSILTPGNEVRIVGSVQYYAAGDQWQISDVSYRMMKPKDPGNIQLLSEGHEPYYTETTLAQLMSQTLLTDENGEESTYAYADLAQNTSAELHKLHVLSISRDDENSRAYLTVEQDGQQLTVIAPSSFVPDEMVGQSITVRGFVEHSSGSVAVRVYETGLLLAE